MTVELRGRGTRRDADDSRVARQRIGARLDSCATLVQARRRRVRSTWVSRRRVASHGGAGMRVAPEGNDPRACWWSCRARRERPTTHPTLDTRSRPTGQGRVGTNLVLPACRPGRLCRATTTRSARSTPGLRVESYGQPTGHARFRIRLTWSANEPDFRGASPGLFIATVS